MAVIYIAVISESDYPAFREIGIGNEFPNDFGAFLQHVKQVKKDFRARGFRTRGVYVDAPGFKRRLRYGKFATYNDLRRYAADLVDRKRKKRKRMRKTRYGESSQTAMK